MLRRLVSHRDLFTSLIRRQYLLRYRQSVAGFAWAVVPALATMLMATLVFDKIAKVDTGDVPYMLFTLSALVPWTMFQSGISSGIPSITQSQTMITRLAFPRAVLPLSMMGTSVVDMAISCVVFVVFLYATGSFLPITAVWFPVLVAIELVLTAGVVLLTSALNVYARDIRFMVPLLTQLWLFLTPVMYPLSEVPENLQDLYLLNPMTGLIESFRTVMLPPGSAPQFELLIPSLVGAGVLLVVGWWYFSATESRFADVV